MEIIYSPQLIFLSVAVAIFASYVALNLAYSVTEAKGKAQLIWLGCGAIAMGVGIWSMHFVGMLAAEMPDMEMAYDVPLMLLSVFVAIAGSALALFIVSRPVVSSRSVVWGGMAMAVAISGMHYIGMYSMRMEARIEWNLPLVAASILIALGASYAALTISIRLRSQPDRFVLLFLASTLMGFAIAGMHYMGMVAATFIHDPSAKIEDSNLIVSSGLTLATISTTMLILGIALATSIGQRIFLLRQKHSDELIISTEEKYRVLVEAVKDYAIFMIDPRGNITTWNRGAEIITGYSAAEMIGKHVSVLYTEKDVNSDSAERELRTVQDTGHFEGEALRRRKDGTTFWANVVLDPLFSKSGRLTGFSKVIRNVTNVKEAAERSRNLNEELERRVQERTVELQEREMQLRSITNAIPIQVAQLNRDEKFLFANEYFCDWFYLDRTKVHAMSFKDALGNDRYPANKIYVDRALKGETVTYERHSYSGGRQAILNITLVPEFDSKRQVKGFILVAANVSNYKKIEAELKTAKEEADAANETKSAFLANMSHEIRTPLGAVIGFSELLLDGQMSADERTNTAEIIKRNGKLLSTIINDILDLSKVEAGKMEIERADVELMPLVNEVAALLNVEASNKGVQLIVSSEEGFPSKIKTDPIRLRQILLNIIGNAVKFTEKGSVNVRVRLNRRDTGKINFTVQDTGTGIAQAQQARLFTPFTQADVTTTRKFGGTGLGLVLSKKLANALGGDVFLTDSTLGRGSTFVITIDHGQDLGTKDAHAVNESHLLKSSEPTVTAKESKLLGREILVVDDSPDNLMLIQRILRIAGAKAEIANSGKEGVEKAMNGKFGIVLMDLQMPGMDGYEATQELRRRGFKKPIIALTAHAMKEERKRCLESGFDEHLTKPIDRDFLVQLISGYPV